jgi:hypothetical protein
LPVVYVIGSDKIITVFSIVIVGRHLFVVAVRVVQNSRAGRGEQLAHRCLLPHGFGVLWVAG